MGEPSKPRHHTKPRPRTMGSNNPQRARSAQRSTDAADGTRLYAFNRSTSSGGIRSSRDG